MSYMPRITLDTLGKLHAQATALRLLPPRLPPAGVRVNGRRWMRRTPFRPRVRIRTAPREWKSVGWGHLEDNGGDHENASGNCLSALRFVARDRARGVGDLDPGMPGSTATATSTTATASPPATARSRPQSASPRPSTAQRLEPPPSLLSGEEALQDAQFVDRQFGEAVEALHGSFERLLAMEPIRDGQLPKLMPAKGVSLFSEGEHHLYVGRSNKLRERYGGHCRPRRDGRARHAFAFLLARDATGRLKAVHEPGPDSRRGLMEDPAFAAAFDAAKARIRAMDYRFVEEGDPTRQGLLEIYCAVALGTSHNDFDTTRSITPYQPSRNPARLRAAI